MAQWHLTQGQKDPDRSILEGTTPAQWGALETAPLPKVRGDIPDDAGVWGLEW